MLYNFLNILRRLKDGELILETIENDICIKQNKSIFKLHMYDALEYPSFIDINNLAKLNVNRNSLISSFKNTNQNTKVATIQNVENNIL